MSEVVVAAKADSCGVLSASVGGRGYYVRHYQGHVLKIDRDNDHSLETMWVANMAMHRDGWRHVLISITPPTDPEIRAVYDAALAFSKVVA